MLRPGGRLAVSDIALKRPLPPELSEDVLAYVGCVAGAISFADYRQGLLDAGFSDVGMIKRCAQGDNMSGLKRDVVVLLKTGVENQ